MLAKEDGELQDSWYRGSISENYLPRETSFCGVSNGIRVSVLMVWETLQTQAPHFDSPKKSRGRPPGDWGTSWGL